MSAIEVHWFVPVNHVDYDRMPASVWIRCLQLIPYLSELGVESKVNVEPESPKVCFFVRSQNKESQDVARRLRERGCAIVFDLCINYYDESGLSENGYGAAPQQVEDCNLMTEIADAITCASDYIGKQASLRHDRVDVLPDSIDRRHFCRMKNEQDFLSTKLRAIWSGVSVKAHELKPILPVLRERKIELTIISDRRPSIGSPFVYRRWRYKRFPRQIVKGEINVSPRSLETPYDLGHSHAKIGFFMAQGVPSIASPQPSYSQLLHNNKGGYVCRDQSEWAEALDLLISDRDLLLRQSRAARDRVEKFLTSSIAGRYHRLIRELSTALG